jgi:hypothetical protein
MNRTVVAAALLAVGISALAQQPTRARAPIDVAVVNGRIVVEESVAVSEKSDGAIIWRLVTRGYRFPDDGIVFEVPGGAFDQCVPIGAEARMYRCRKVAHEAGKRYKYDVNVIDPGAAGGPLRLETLDPWIQNN